MEVWQTLVAFAAVVVPLLLAWALLEWNERRSDSRHEKRRQRKQRKSY